MSDEERSKQEEGAPNLVRKYELMLLEDQNWYFDLDQFETIIEYYFDQNEFEKSLEALSYAKEIFKMSAELIMLEAQVEMALGHLNKSIALLKQTITIQPTNEEAHILIASLYSQLRQTEKSIIHLEKALEFSDEVLKDELYLDLAMEYENIDDYNSAIDVLKQALQLNPENEGASYELAFCYEETKELDSAIQYFNEFIDDHPYSFPTWYSLGNMYLKKGESLKAITAFDFCISIQDDFTPALINIASAFMHIGAYDKSISALEEAIEIEGETEEILSFIGECYEKLNRPEEAFIYFESALELNPNFYEAIIGLAISLVDLEKPKEAIPFLEKALENKGNKIETSLILSDVYCKIESFDTAGEIYNALLKEFPKDSKVNEAVFDYIFIYLKEYDKALSFIEGSVDLIEDNVGLIHRKVLSYYALKKTKLAMDVLSQLVDTNKLDKEYFLDTYSAFFDDPEVIALLN